MSIARILTRSPQEAEPLAAQLRARGYTVEILAPDAETHTDVEVEVTLECCDANDALAHTTDLAAGDLDIWVARGTFADAAPAPSVQEPKADFAAPEAVVTQPYVERERSRVMRDFAQAAGAAFRHAIRRAREYASAAAAGAGVLAHGIKTRIATQGTAWRQRRTEAQRQAIAARRTSAARIPRRLVPQRRPAAARLPVIRRTRSRDYEWRTAGIFSVGLAAAIMVGWAAANRRPATPLPTSVLIRSSNVEQDVPFGPVTVPAPGSRTHQGARKPVPSVKASAKKDLAGDVVVRHFTRTGDPAPADRRTPRADSADEVVIRHFGPAAPAEDSRQGVKRIVVND